jgi:tRNA(Ile)-lysidine synthase
MPASLIAAIEQLIAQHSGPVCIGFSGGLDSSVLLACAARSDVVRARGLSALHVHHGLHADADLWTERAQATTAALEVPLTVVRVQVELSGHGLEAAARAARHAAFAEHVQSGWLLLAHHQEDQAETVLLRLFRGAALDGVAAMRPVRALGPAWLGRPWLAQPRSSLRDCARELGLQWIEDPSNRDPRHDRVYLRETLWPLLQSRFPAAGERLARFAEHAQAVQAEIAELARAHLAQLQADDPRSLSINGLLGLSAALFGQCVRDYAFALGFPAPGFHELARLRQEVLLAGQHANPCLRWRGFEFRRYRDRLFLLPEADTRPAPAVTISWNADEARCVLPEGLGFLEAIDVQDQSQPIGHDLSVRFRRAGERIRPDGCAHTRELRLLFQERGVPTWERGRVPLLYAGKALLAAVGLVASEEFAALCPGLRVVWRQ